jgi:hypothetical protein
MDVAALPAPPGLRDSSVPTTHRPQDLAPMDGLPVPRSVWTCARHAHDVTPVPLCQVSSGRIRLAARAPSDVSSRA